MKLLVTADIHLGRRAARLPEDELEVGAMSDVWAATVEAAVQHGVAALLLSGDVVDETNRFFEAVGPLEAGFRQLRDQGIPTLAVAGNHDVEVLAQLADTLGPETFRFLGRGGVWERALLPSDGGELQVFGWSYPHRRVSHSPLPHFPAAEYDPTLPAVGMLHADLGAAAGDYCPVQRAEFAATPVALWFLGHIHKPTVPAADGESPILFYPGSPQGLDPGPGELGPHGPWLVELSPARPVFRQLLLASVRYDTLTLDLEETVEETQFRKRLVAGIRSAVQDAKSVQESLRVLSLRLEIAGRTAVPHAVLCRQVADLAESGLVLDEVRVHVNDFTLTAHPPLDLAALSRGRGILSELARLLQDLEAGSDAAACEPGFKRLPEVIRDAVATVYGASAFAPLADEAPAGGPKPHACAALLRRQAWLLLEELMRQGEGHG